MTDMCPCCGYNLSKDRLIEIDGFTIDPRGMVSFGELVMDSVSATQVMILHSIAKAAPRPISMETLRNRITDGSSNVVSVMICRMRKIFAANCVPFPIRTVGQIGYRWQVPANTAIEAESSSERRIDGKSG